VAGDDNKGVKGYALNQLNNPNGIYIDSDDNL